MPAINAGLPVRFENGGVLTLTISATAYTISNIVGGSIEFVEPSYEEIEYKDRGLQQQPGLGDQRLGMLKCTCQATTFAASDLRDRLKTAGSAGKVYEFDSIIFDVPAYRGASTGMRYTALGASLKVDTLKYKAGSEWDQVEFEMRIRTSMTPVAY